MPQQALPAIASIEARIAAIEAEVATLKKQIENGKSKGWLDDIIGSTNDMSDADFNDVVRYGREAREARPRSDEVPA